MRLSIMLLTGLSTRKLLILRLLSAMPEAYGLDLVHLSGGRIASDTVYAWLADLEERRLVSVRHERGRGETGRLPRRIYSITPAGRTALRDAASSRTI
jgi:DNA-binding PadR family transcriptional regulator